MNDSLVIIPTYNERENVVRMLVTVMGLEFPFDVLVVDDGSPDGTAALVREVQASHPDRIHLLERKGKLPPGLAKRELPRRLDNHLPDPWPGTERKIVGNDVVLLEKGTDLILDVLRNVVLR